MNKDNNLIENNEIKLIKIINVLLALKTDETFLSLFRASSAYFNLSYFSIQCVQRSGFTPILFNSI